MESTDIFTDLVNFFDEIYLAANDRGVLICSTASE